MAQDPKAVVQRLADEVWNGGDVAAAEALLADDFVWRHPTLGDRRGRAAALEAIAEMRAAFPDFTVTIEQIVAEGDTVMTYWVATGTHRNAYQGAPPTNEQVTWGGMAWDRVVNGRIVERRTVPDTMTPGGPRRSSAAGALLADSVPSTELDLASSGAASSAKPHAIKAFQCVYRNRKPYPQEPQE